MVNHNQNYSAGSISLVRQIFFNVLLIMTNDSSENLEKAQKVRAAESES